MADCKNKEKNLKSCTCTYEGCERAGMCCECVAYHRAMKEVPGCLFSKEGEASYDRSIGRFKKAHM